MKAALLADETLDAYLDSAVEIREWKPDELPDFDKYCVVLSFAGESEEHAGLKSNDKIFEVLIVCLVRNYGFPDALMGTTPPNKAGLFKLVDDVKDCLRGNDLANAVMPDNDVFAGSSETSRAFPENTHIFVALLGYRARRRFIV